MKYYLFMVLFLLIGSVAALDLEVKAPSSVKVGDSILLNVSLLAERNYSHQIISLNVSGSPSVLFNGCNQTYISTFGIDARKRELIRVPLRFSTPGEYTIITRAANTKSNVTTTTNIRVNGTAIRLKEYCIKNVGYRRERWGMGQVDIVKQRLQTIPKRYAVWWKQWRWCSDGEVRMLSM
jgi:hypothetical protein